MKQEASNNTETYEYGSLSIEFMDDQIHDLEEDPEKDFEPNGEPHVVYSYSGPKSVPSCPNEPQNWEKQVNQPYSSAMIEKIVEFDADKTARINNIKIIYLIIANYVESITNKKSVEFYVNVMIKYGAAVSVRGTFSMTVSWVDVVRKTTKFMRKKSRFYRKLQKAIINYCCSNI